MWLIDGFCFEYTEKSYYIDTPELDDVRLSDNGTNTARLPLANHCCFSDHTSEFSVAFSRLKSIHS